MIDFRTLLLVLDVLIDFGRRNRVYDVVIKITIF